MHRICFRSGEPSHKSLPLYRKMAMEGIVLWPEPIGSELHLPAEPSAPSQVTLDGKGDPVGLMPQAVAPRTVRTACRMRFGELFAVVKISRWEASIRTYPLASSIGRDLVRDERVALTRWLPNAAPTSPTRSSVLGLPLLILHVCTCAPFRLACECHGGARHWPLTVSCGPREGSEYFVHLVEQRLLGERLLQEWVGAQYRVHAALA